MQNMQTDHRLLKTIRHEPVDRTPIWIMRQAGRYLPEYRATRAKAGSFINLCKTPELACEVTLQPLIRYPLDAAIIFSDILTIPDAMGLGLSMQEGQGPVFAHPVRDDRTIARLTVPDPAQLNYVYAAIRLVRQELAGKVPLIGFCGSPWTLAAYMVEGKSQPGFPIIQKMRQDQPALLHQLLKVLAQAVTAHLLEQIRAGAEVVMLFDTWGGMLAGEDYMLCSLPYLQQIITDLKTHAETAAVPVILFTKGGHGWLEEIAMTGCDMVGVDWEISLAAARARIGQRTALQGNLHPACLLTTPATIRAEVAQVLASYGQGSGHVFNLGHGITPDVPPDHVTVLVEAVHELSQPYHQC
ncbi:MAG TPA: uroporphyrinogen decarboxylase [Gammaproteobacteria bacterium]|jgi:uroporphyrinogen decarboxylase|nr:uroporphyrinogen decarboxylase [Gammaproteobacteria bacterium]